MYRLTRSVYLVPLVLACGGLFRALPDEKDVVFRSDVSLVRVDVQVLDRDNRAITGLKAEDFVLREEGRPQTIRNFTREEMPVDVLFLFDVSASMRPHVERIANAAHDAFRVLGDNDRVAITVFDRAMRLRMPFRNGRQAAERELDNMIRQESFHGGTDITRALVAAASYIELHGRREARRAIVILTDDQTEFERDEAGVSRSLERADAVLSALIAPDAMRSGTYSPGGGRGGSYPGGGWPGGSSGGPLGGIILGRRGGYGGRRPGVVTGPHTQSAGTAEIARQSGGDSLPVDDASALETTLARIRQRYALHFLVPPDVRSGQERSIDVALADGIRRRYPDADLRFRRTYLPPSGSGVASKMPASTEVIVNTDPVVIAPAVSTDVQPQIAPSPGLKRRPAISEPEGPRGPNPSVGDVSVRSTGTGSGVTPQAAPAPNDPKAADTQAPRGGWRRLKPGEVPN